MEVVFHKIVFVEGGGAVLVIDLRAWQLLGRQSTT
jgi:hypothetical protein